MEGGISSVAVINSVFLEWEQIQKLSVGKESLCICHSGEAPTFLKQWLVPPSLEETQAADQFNA